ncbi:unnamed protein product [Nippostrongylus brasiliensis]|uniref:DDE Tnp4 domain-containing protein n=1 Tax=Nippostrongylus brasiliensis TaxID=27835 RepID=A0A0N4YC66_NIPBR|nr:unnamed protein product [Nippostrongylus brasiliensis]
MAISRMDSDDYRNILMRKCYTCEFLGRPLCEKALRVCLEIADLESNSRSAISRISSQSKTRRRRYYVRPAHSDKLDIRFLSFDDYIASLDHQQFHEYTRLTPKEFDELHSRIAPRLEHRKCHRFPVSSVHRLAITMRFLGHGSGFVALSHEVRLGRATVMKIVYECCRAIKDELWSDTFPTPTAADWHQSAEQFRRLWRYPRAVASIDAKHFRCNAPRKSGSSFYNHEGSSIVLLAIVSGGYRIIAFDVGGKGKNSDSSLFRMSTLKPFLEEAKSQFPRGGDLNGQGHVDYHVLADGRARRIVESVFGILSVRFRVFQMPLCGLKMNCNLMIITALVLHNLLANRLTPQQMLQRYPPHAATYVENDGQYSRARLRKNAQRQRSRMLVTITLGSYNYICFTILERLLDSAAKYKPISVQFTMNSLVLLLYVSFVLLVYV